MPQRILTGQVIKNSSAKTVVVQVNKMVFHPLYKKSQIRPKKYMAHDEENAFSPGTWVRIQESRPISKRKTWVVIGPATSQESKGGHQ